MSDEPITVELLPLYVFPVIPQPLPLLGFEWIVPGRSLGIAWFSIN